MGAIIIAVAVTAVVVGTVFALVVRARDAAAVPPASLTTITNPRLSNRRLRASTDERTTVVWVLERHLAGGRLDDHEFYLRRDLARKAATRGELAALLDDLPTLRQPGQGGYRMHEGYDEAA